MKRYISTIFSKPCTTMPGYSPELICKMKLNCQLPLRIRQSCRQPTTVLPIKQVSRAPDHAMRIAITSSPPSKTPPGLRATFPLIRSIYCAGSKSIATFPLIRSIYYQHSCSLDGAGEPRSSLRYRSKSHQSGFGLMKCHRQIMEKEYQMHREKIMNDNVMSTNFHRQERLTFLQSLPAITKHKAG